MSATFQSLRETRQPKAEKAVSLLQNLVRYEHTEQEAKDLVNAINDAADDLDAVFAKKWGWVEEIDTPKEAGKPVDTGVGPIATLRTDAPTYRYEPRTRLPSGTAEGGASFDAEVRWAYDALRRGDTKLAADRLRRILKGGE